MIGKQLDQSLDRLQTDHVDVYFMHRDNPDVPVGEFVDAMDREVKAGRIRGPFGGSNWTMARMDEAIAYAERTGKQKPGALSNHFSLAEMLDADLAGLRHRLDRRMEGLAHRPPDAEFRMVEPGRAASSRSAPAATNSATRNSSASGIRTKISDAVTEQSNLRTGWARARSMLRSPMSWRSPFPPFPLIGPRTLDELEDSLGALDISLSRDDLEWLDGAVPARILSEAGDE